MTTFIRAGAIGGLAALALVPATGARAQSVLEQSIEHRFQLDFHVNDSALQKMLPAGWVPAVATAGPAKDANIRMIFIDQVAIMGADGKPLGKGANRMAILEVPVKAAQGDATGRMIIAGLSADANAAPGAFGVYRPAATASMARAVTAKAGTVNVDETWNFAAADGEHMQVHVAYERAPARKGGGETKFFNPSDPSRYQIVKTDQGIDITRNATTHPPDHVTQFSYAAGGGAIGTLFDGSEKVLSWDSFPWYDRTVTAP
jgi:hypothetical protein